ncbi:hypothetical protein LGQ02_15225 [Bacillus shivajii]|uniref:hypothetical protein n=1 Tax=Bacillus shivajii TaxID=1983719 RepID=UPI001CF99F70|nr:hypothetical protein [Bacillus shivajii]UCZ52186.1 hypothetical protein LGQ02_15225 [Bacillus shivajii]
MEKLRSVREIDWIYKEKEELGTDEGAKISCLIPPRYESYIKVLEPIYLDKSVKDDNLTWEEAREEEFNDHNLIQMTYQDFAKRYGLIYTKDINIYTFYRHLGGSMPRCMISSEGTFEPSVLKQFVEVLKPKTLGKCYFYYDIISSHMDLKGEFEHLYYGNIEDVLLLNDIHGSPTYWWSEDKSWIVNTDSDLDCNLFGGEKAVVDQLLRIKSAEIFEVPKISRVDWDADYHINPGKGPSSTFTFYKEEE